MIQKQPSTCVPIKRCSENIAQIYRRTQMSKCDFNKVLKQLYWNHTSAWVFSCKFAAYFQNTFSLEHFWRAASVKTLGSYTKGVQFVPCSSLCVLVNSLKQWPFPRFNSSSKEKKDQLKQNQKYLLFFFFDCMLFNFYW